MYAVELRQWWGHPILGAEGLFHDPPLCRADLKEVGPEGQDPFGNFTIDVNTLAAFPSVPHLGAAAALAATEQCTTEQHQATTLTGEFGATALGSEAATATTRAKSGGQRKASGKAQQASKGEPLDAKSVRKQLALQEKNRRAQRRFRERQKQKVGGVIWIMGDQQLGAGPRNCVQSSLPGPRHVPDLVLLQPAAPASGCATGWAHRP